MVLPFPCCPNCNTTLSHLIIPYYKLRMKKDDIVSDNSEIYKKLKIKRLCCKKYIMTVHISEDMMDYISNH